MINKTVPVSEVCTVIKDGFEGMLLRADRSVEQGKALIVVGGSEGGLRTALPVAGVFASRGVDSLAVAYFGTKQTPRHLSLIAVETILHAVKYLHDRGYKKTGIYGISKGAELSLVSASLIPEISFVIAVSPSCCVFEGIAKPGYCGTSSWSWKGKALPGIFFVPYIQQKAQSFCNGCMLLSVPFRKNAIKPVRKHFSIHFHG
jgi:hypothetical protein